MASSSHSVRGVVGVVLVSMLLLFGNASARASSIMPRRLTCEYLTNPLVIDIPQPRLAWINEPSEGAVAQTQTAYQIEVASDQDQLLAGKADLWRSGRVKSPESIHIRYGGKALTSGMDCWWRVRTWDAAGNVSPWSEPSKWHMGFLDAGDWRAEWIGAPWQGEEGVANSTHEPPHPAPMLRKQFQVTKQVKSAYIYTTGLGYFELYCNGGKVGDDVLVPNQTLWGKRPNLHDYGIPVRDNFTEYRVMYLCYDLTKTLKEGDNALGALLGNGFYNSPSKWILPFGTPRFIAQLEITYTDGTRETVVTDASWRAERSPIVFDRLYDGERYDARLEYPGWSDAGYDDANWVNVVKRSAPEGVLKAQMAYSDKVMESLEPVTIEKLSGNGCYRVDFGEEISGWLRLSGINGPRGHRIDIRFLSESPNGTNSYTLSGDGNESYAVRFTWFVFRTVEISGWPGELTKEQIRAEAVYTQTHTTGHFECSNPLFNQINQIWKRSQTDNMHGGIASDCPHRERSAYTGDGQVVLATVAHNYDVAAFYKKWIEDVVGAQDKTTGYVPNGAPWQPGCGGGVAWGAAITIMPWEYYQIYADRAILAYCYEGMKRYVAYMQQWVDADGIVLQQAPNRANPHEWMNLGDWCPPGKFPPTELVHTFYFWLCALNTANTAEVLGQTDDAEVYERLAEETKAAFVKRFYKEAEGTFGRYGANIFALKMGLDEHLRKRVTAALQRDIVEAGGHLDTGIFGTRYFFEVLCDNGLNELAYEAMNKTTYPSFGHWISQGATTTWEQWDGGNSRNHPMFGGGLTWFYRKLAGMVAAAPGYREILFRPNPAGDMTYASYYTLTPYGNAGIRWDRQEDAIRINVTVPVGCRALVYVPMPVHNPKAEHIKYIGSKDGYACYRVASGDYVFHGTIKQ